MVRSPLLILALVLAGAAGGCGGSTGGARVGGGFIVFSCGPGYANLCRVDSDGQNERRLTHGGRTEGPGYGSPSLSADGRKLAFVFGGRAYTSSPEGDRRRGLTRLRDVAFVTVTADGRRAAVLRRVGSCPPTGVGLPCTLKSDLYVVGGANGSARHVADWVGAFEWRGGPLVMFNADLDPNHLVVLSGPGLRSRRLVPAPHRVFIRDLAVSPDQKTIAASVLRPNGHVALVLLSASTGQIIRPLTEGPVDSQPAWSPDGKWAVFRSGHRLEVISASGSRRRSLGVDGASPTWGG